MSVYINSIHSSLIDGVKYVPRKITLLAYRLHNCLSRKLKFEVFNLCSFKNFELHNKGVSVKYKFMATILSKDKSNQTKKLSLRHIFY